MTKKRWALAGLILLSAGLVLAGGGGWAEARPLLLVPAFPVPTLVVALLAACLGGLAVWIWQSGTGDEKTERKDLMIYAPLPATIGLAALFLFAQKQGLPAAQSAIALLLAVIAMLAALRCFDRLGKGETIGIESHWGGLGGGSSGWRLSSATSLALLALAFAGASLALVVIDPSIPVAAQETGAAAEAKENARGEAGGTDKAAGETPAAEPAE